MNKQLILTATMAVLILIPRVYAEDQPKPEAYSKQHDLQKIFDQLNLSEDQRKQLEANKKAQRDQMEMSFKQMKALKDSLSQELMKPQLDMNSINKIQGQIKSHMNAMADSRLKSILEVRKTLTPEQFTKFLGIMSEKHRWGRDLKNGMEAHQKNESS